MKQLLIGGGVLMVVACFIVISTYREKRANNTVSEFINSKQWQMKAENFKKCEKKDECIVFLGNSLTEGFNLALFEKESLINMGISGDFTQGVINRLNKVTEANPKKVFLMIGINDIIEKVPLSDIEENYLTIINTIQSKCPQTKIYIQSNLPIHGRYSFFTSTESVNDKVVELNTFLQQTSKEHQLAYIDLYSLFVKEGGLNKNLTYDGIHLNKHGYQLWKTKVKPLLDN